jgi:hypothetical protein
MDPVADVLAQFPGSVSLAFSRWKLLYYAAFSFVFVAFGIHGITDPAGRHVIMGWACAILGVIGIPAFAVALIPGASEMVLDQDGFTLRFAHRTSYWTWTEVCDFAVIKDYLVPFKKNVAFNRKGGRGTKRSESGELPAWRDIVLDDSYGLTKDDCVRLLSEWQQRALKNARHSAGISSGGSQSIL